MRKNNNREQIIGSKKTSSGTVMEIFVNIIGKNTNRIITESTCLFDFESIDFIWMDRIPYKKKILIQYNTSYTFSLYLLFVFEIILVS